MAQYTLPDLRYDYGSLEPHISGKIMELHHDKHHAGYVKGANTTLEKLDEARDKEDFTRLAALEKALAFNLSGHVLHSLFWQNLTPKGGGRPDGRARRTRSTSTSASFEKFQKQMKEVAGDDHGIGLGGARLGAARRAPPDDADLRPPVEPRARRESRSSCSTRGSTPSTCSTRTARPSSSTRSGTCGTGRTSRERFDAARQVNLELAERSGSGGARVSTPAPTVHPPRPCHRNRRRCHDRRAAPRGEPNEANASGEMAGPRRPGAPRREAPGAPRRGRRAARRHDGGDGSAGARPRAGASSPRVACVVSGLRRRAAGVRAARPGRLVGPEAAASGDRVAAGRDARRRSRETRARS